MPGRKRDDQIAMNARQRARRHDQAAITGARECRDAALDLAGVAQVDRAYLHAKRRRHGLDDGELADPAVMVGSRRTAARVTPGAISLSSSSHFALKPYSNSKKPVALPPGRDRAFDEASADRIDGEREHDRHRAGRLEHWRQRTAKGQDDVRRERDQFRRVFAIVFGVRLRPSENRSAHCWPSVQPNCCSACRNAAMRTLLSGSSAAEPESTPMRCTRSAC